MLGHRSCGEHCGLCSSDSCSCGCPFRTQYPDELQDGNSERRALLGNDMVTDQPGSRPQMNEGETSGEMQ